MISSREVRWLGIGFYLTVVKNKAGFLFSQIKNGSTTLLVLRAGFLKKRPLRHGSTGSPQVVRQAHHKWFDRLTTGLPPVKPGDPRQGPDFCKEIEVSYTPNSLYLPGYSGALYLPFGYDQMGLGG
jgi:hypothetical protein